MPRYHFRARNPEGGEVTGEREAQDSLELGRALRAEQLLLIESKQLGGRRKFALSIPFFGGVSVVELMLFTRNLAVMVEAGLDLPRAFEVLIRQVQSKRFKAKLADVREQIVRGGKIADALARHKDIFSDLFVAMVAVGEESGQLVEVLRLLSDQLEKAHILRSRVRGALIYPAIVVATMIGIGLLMFVFVVPRLKDVFSDFDVQLPITTRLIFGFSDVLLHQWYFIVPGSVAILWIFMRLLSTKQGKRLRDKVFMRLPLFKNLLRQISSAQIARSLSSLITAGVPIVRGLNITAGTLQNVYFRESLEAAAQSVERGKTIHEAFSLYSWVYPPLVVEMVAVGEETGKLGDLLEKLADFYEKEVDRATQNLAGIIEPVLMIVIGAVVGVFAVSMLMPMYTMIGNVT